MDEAMLRPDCTRCAALCCVGLAFDRSDKFAFDKAAGVPCRHLTDDDRCSIHADLARRGFGGCVSFDCLGAGQRVTQELFAGRSWRDQPAIAGAMFDAFRGMRLVHELLSLLRTAAQLPLTPEQSRQRSEFEDRLAPPEGWSPETLIVFEQSEAPREIRAFLTTLRDNAQPGRAHRDKRRRA